MPNHVPNEKSSTESPSVYVLSPGGPIPREWEIQAKASGVHTSRVATLSSVKTKLSFTSNPVLVIRYGTDQDLGLQLLKKMLKLPELHGLTLVVVGEEAESLEQELSRVQRIVISRNEPCNAYAFVDTLKRAVELNGPSAKNTVDAGRAPPGLDLSVPPEITKTDFTEKLFEFLRSDKLRGKVIGGHRYVGVSNSNQLLEDLLTANEWSKEILGPIIHSNDTWLKHHAARSAYMTDKILGALDLSEEQRKLGQFGAILRTEAFVGKPRLLRADYYRDRNGTLRTEIAEALRKSSRKIAERTGDPQISDLVAKTANLIEGKGESVAGDDAIMASSIVASDAVERACWSMGFFNSLRAYLLLRRWKGGGAPSVHFGVLCCAAKFVSEGVIAVPFRHTLAKGAQIVPSRLHDSIDGSPAPADWGRIVSLEALSPGMQLVSPLVTYDGKEILGSDVKLDDDLIWRIWQLAAIRPIRSACVAR